MKKLLAGLFCFTACMVSACDTTQSQAAEIEQLAEDIRQFHAHVGSRFDLIDKKLGVLIARVDSMEKNMNLANAIAEQRRLVSLRANVSINERRQQEIAEASAAGVSLRQHRLGL